MVQLMHGFVQIGVWHPVPIIIFVCTVSIGQMIGTWPRGSPIFALCLAPRSHIPGCRIAMESYAWLIVALSFSTLSCILCRRCAAIASCIAFYAPVLLDPLVVAAAFFALCPSDRCISLFIYIYKKNPIALIYSDPWVMYAVGFV